MQIGHYVHFSIFFSAKREEVLNTGNNELNEQNSFAHANTGICLRLQSKCLRSTLLKRLFNRESSQIQYFSCSTAAYGGDWWASMVFADSSVIGTYLDAFSSSGIKNSLRPHSSGWSELRLGAEINFWWNFVSSPRKARAMVMSASCSIIFFDNSMSRSTVEIALVWNECNLNWRLKSSSLACTQSNHFVFAARRAPRTSRLVACCWHNYQH